MSIRMNLAAFVAVVALAALVAASPAPAGSDPAAATPAKDVAETAAAPVSLAENPLRTINRDAECRPGLCPHIRRLVPDLTHAPPHVHEQLTRGVFVGEPSLCGNLCIHDKVCPGHQKCCPTTCGYACQDTVHIHEEY